MNRAVVVGGIVAAAILILVAFNSLFVVDQTAQALVIQFGQPVREVRDPGLHVKSPLQNVVFYDRRVLDYEPTSEEVIAADQKRLVVDSFARYRIVDPLQFYRSVGTEAVMQLRLGATISGTLRRVLGNVVLSALLSPERARIMAEIRDQVATQAKSFGIEVIDVRIRRADLPQENSQAIYARMQSERQREANEYRAQGAEQAQGIRARAERDRTVILAEATKQSQIRRGQGDAESIKIYADAFGKDPDFFTFYRSLEAYRTALGPDTTMVLSPNSEFFQYFGQHKAAKPQ
ncbi:MAG TPA: protease modulator HflC [Aliidongia sp.]|nr:protease modulator HflC [Aliidongia sp.]